MPRSAISELELFLLVFFCGYDTWSLCACHKFGVRGAPASLKRFEKKFGKITFYIVMFHIFVSILSFWEGFKFMLTFQAPIHFLLK